MTGLEIKLGIGRQRKSSIGSLALPDAQEKRIFQKLADAQQDVRALTKSITASGNRMAFGLGASAVATLGAAFAVVWAAHENAKRVRSFGR